MISVIKVYGKTVKRIISEIILNITFPFMYVFFWCVYRILLSTSEIFSIISKNVLLLITEMKTTAITLLVHEEIVNKMKAIKKTVKHQLCRLQLCEQAIQQYIQSAISQ
jgi:hypothetical protein